MIQQTDRDLDVAKPVEDQADVPAEYWAKGYIRIAAANSTRI